MTGKPIVVWFRRDLRLADNPALHAAAESGQPVLPAFVLDERDEHCWDDGEASRWWLHHSLESLDEALRERGGQLVLRRGDTAHELAALIAESGADRMHYAAGIGPEEKALEKSVEATLAERIGLHAFSGRLLHEPGTVRTAAGGPYKIFTPFWRACRELPDPSPPHDAPGELTFANVGPIGDTLSDWRLTPSSPDWAGGLSETWKPGEPGALARIRAFVERAPDYASDRDRPDREGTSRLSPHLHFGEVSPRQLWHDLRRFCEPSDKGAAAFLRQLYWREFSYHLLHDFPQLPSEPLREEFRRFPWRRDDEALLAWQRGQTGYPIVDAGMRQLWHTGWMHNRIRLLAASLLVKHLLIPWQAGAAWFHDTLVDADQANNSAGWQWVAGCGTDAAPYFRIFNPVTQGRKFDPDGRYTRRWVPELAKLETSALHAPWEASEKALQEAGITLDGNYPRPIVEHRFARERALDAYRRTKDN